MRYRSKPTEVEAVQWTGENHEEIQELVGTKCIIAGGELQIRAGKDGSQGWVHVPDGHWVVRNPGDPSDYWPVDPDYFANKYEPLPELPPVEDVIEGS